MIDIRYLLLSIFSIIQLLAFEGEYISPSRLKNAIVDISFSRGKLVDPKKQEIDIDQIFDGCIISISSVPDLRKFFEKIHPMLNCRYVLLTYICGWSQNLSGFFSYFEDPKLIAWIGHMHDARVYAYEKCYPLPLGLRDNTISSVIKVNNLPEKDRENFIYLNFNPRTNKDRQVALDAVLEKPFVVNEMPNIKEGEFKSKSLGMYLQDLKNSIFVLSPRGYAPDCYRTWETLYTGGIPIVKTSDIDFLYEGLPVIIVDEWSDITKEFLLKKYEEFLSKDFLEERLTPSYWKEFVYDIIEKEGIIR